MSLKELYLLCFLVTWIPTMVHGIVNQTFYVSLDGENTPGCGKSDHPCKTIDEVFVQQKKNTKEEVNLTIYIDGGTSKQSIYQQSTTISVSPKIIFLQLTSFSRRPLFNNDFHEQFIPLFQYSKTPTLRIENIDFEHISPLSFSGDKDRLNGNIHLINCTWNIRSINYIKYDFIQFTSLTSGIKLTVTMDNFKLQSATKVIPIIRDVQSYQSHIKWSINIKDSTFTSCGFHIEADSGSLIIKNTRFFGYVPAMFFIDISGFSEITISNIITRHEGRGPPWPPTGDRGMGKIQNSKNVVIESSVFTSDTDTFNFNNVSVAEIHDCSFTNINHGNVVLYFNGLNLLKLTRNNVSEINWGTFLYGTVIGSIYVNTITFENLESVAIYLDRCKNIRIEEAHFFKTNFPLQITRSVDVYLQRSTFHQCYTGENTISQGLQNGGGIYISNGGTMTLKQCNFTRNVAKTQGGAIYSENTNVTIIDSIFDKNNAPSCGTFRFTGNDNLISFNNVNITSPQGEDNLPAFSVIMENNGPTLDIKRSHIHILSSVNSIDIFTTNLTSASSFSYYCPKDTHSDIANKNLFSCKHCEKGKYSLDAGSAIFYNGKLSPNSRNISCIKCPSGGNCQGSKEIEARINFWGYEHDSKIEFIQCMDNYCCNDLKQCKGINSCNKNRKGKICGTCKQHYYINFFNNQCIHEDICKHKDGFWISFASIIFVLLILIGFLPDIGRVLKRCCTRNVDSTKPLIEKISIATVLSGFLKILVNFYQMNLLISVPHVSSDSSGAFEIVKEILPSIFNFKITVQNYFKEFCPSKQLNKIDKTFILNILPVLTLLVLALFLFIVYKFVKWLRNCAEIRRDNNNDESYHPIEPSSNDEWMPFDVRCKVFVVRCLLIMYTNIISYIMMMIHWVTLPDGPVLLISGDTSLFNPKTYTCIVFFFLFALAFPPNTYLIARWLQERQISNNWFVLCFTFPPMTIVYCVWNKYKAIVYPERDTPADGIDNNLYQNADSQTNPMSRQESHENNHNAAPEGESTINFDLDSEQEDTHEDSFKTQSELEKERLLRVLEDPFRERKSVQKPMLWDPVILFRRFLIALLCVFITNYVIRMAVVIPVLFLMCVHHSKVLPFKVPFLNMVEITCFYILSFLATINLFWAFFYVYGLDYQNPIRILGEILKYTDLVFTLTPFLIFVWFCLHKLFRSCCKKIRRKCL